MKSLWDIDFKSRANCVGIICIILGLAKAFFSDFIDLEYGAVQMITFGAATIYLREGVKK